MGAGDQLSTLETGTLTVPFHLCYAPTPPTHLARAISPPSVRGAGVAREPVGDGSVSGTVGGGRGGSALYTRDRHSHCSFSPMLRSHAPHTPHARNRPAGCPWSRCAAPSLRAMGSVVGPFGGGVGGQLQTQDRHSRRSFSSILRPRAPHTPRMHNCPADRPWSRSCGAPSPRAMVGQWGRCRRSPAPRGEAGACGIGAEATVERRAGG